MMYYTSSIPMGAISFYMQEHFFTLADTITPIFTMITEVWPCANQAMFTNNYTVLTEVRANQNHVNRGFPVIIIIIIIIDHDFLPTPRRGSFVKSDKTHTQSSRYTP